jgi:pilus assembly protein CpaF
MAFGRKRSASDRFQEPAATEPPVAEEPRAAAGTAPYAAQAVATPAPHSADIAATLPQATPRDVDTQPSPGSLEPPAAAARGSVGQADASYETVRQTVLDRIDVSAAVMGGRAVMAQQLRPVVSDIALQQRLRLSRMDQDLLLERLLDDMFGLGPIEPLLADSSITDILINGPDQVYVERFGKLTLTDVTFADNDQLTNIAQRIAAGVGRRVDEASPLVDARLADGSRINIVTKPLALNGTCMSIRKFARHRIGFAKMVKQGNMSAPMARLLEIAARIRLNVIVSGGTGSGKTTLLNALSGMIAADERVVTIEDAAELQLQQPHVVRLETRPMNLEGNGAIDQRQLVINALRMRPDRIILGETRGAEAFDVLQAMNTGHDGSMTTVHANTARDALVRLENMVISGNPNLPLRFVRAQIVSAVHLIVQVSRMRDGVRRVTQIVEVAGVEGDTVSTQELFTFSIEGGAPGEALKGRFESSGLRPLFAARARDYGLAQELETLMDSL